MAKTDFTVSATASVTDALVSGNLSGSGSFFLRLTSSSSGQTYHAMKTGVTDLDHGVDAYFRRSVSLGLLGILLRASAVSPLTGYECGYTSSGTTITRFTAGVGTVLISGSGATGNGTIGRYRAMIKGSRIVLQKEIAAAFSTILDVVDPAPLGAGAPGFMGRLSSGETNDLDAWHSFDTV